VEIPVVLQELHFFARCDDYGGGMLQLANRLPRRLAGIADFGCGYAALWVSLARWSGLSSRPRRHTWRRIPDDTGKGILQHT
jgi:hypothetical protein